MLSAPELFTWLQSLFPGAPRGMIFDCDGVIIDSRRANIGYYNALRTHLHLPPIPPEMESFVQMSTVHQALAAIIPEPLRPLLPEAAKSVNYERDILPTITHYPGIHALLDLCKAHGIRLGMDTNREDGMDLLLKNCRLQGYFDPIVLACHVRRPKPFPDGAIQIARAWNLPPDQLLFVGDSATDRNAAHAAGMPFLAFQNESLAERCVADFATLRAALAKFCPELPA